LPAKWREMKLQRIQAFGHRFDIDITRQGDKVKVDIKSEGTPIDSHVIATGETLNILLT
jgi:hypothetical protein